MFLNKIQCRIIYHRGPGNISHNVTTPYYTKQLFPLDFYQTNHKISDFSNIAASP